MSEVINNDDYGTLLESGAVRFTRLLPGPIERVWEYVTVPEKRGTWLAAGEMELRVGGRVTLDFHNATLAPQGEAVPERFRKYTGPITQHGRITQLETPRLLAMTWGDKGDGSPASEVVFELTPKGKDVLLVLTHRRLTSPAEGLSVSSGWHTHLGVLAAAMRGEKASAFWQKLDQVDQHYKQHFTV